MTEQLTLQDPRPDLIPNTFKALRKTDRAGALHCFEQLWNSIDDLPDNAAKPVIIAAALIELPQEVWSQVKQRLWVDDELAKVAFLQIADVRWSAQEEWSLELSARETGEFYCRLRQLFPFVEDPPFGKVNDARGMIPRLRDGQLGKLTSMGTKEACEELLRLGTIFPDERLYLNWRYRECLSTYRKLLWRPQAPETILQLIENNRRRLVLNENDLLEVTLESLNRFQEELTQTKNPQIGDLWNYEGAGTHRRHYSPKDEEDLSGKIAAWLQNDLGPTRGVILNREVQLRRGRRTDILVEALAPNGSALKTLTIVIEVKGCWNREIATSLKDQLIDLYLTSHGWTHGIYLVGWFLCPKWDSPTRPANNALAAATFEEAQTEIRQMAKPYQAGKSPWLVQGYVLDCRIS